MSITRDEFWSIDGTPLETFAFGLTVESEPGLAGSRTSGLVLPQRHGQVRTRRFLAPMTRTLTMFVTDTDADGVVQSGRAQRRAQRNENMAALQRLFMQTRRPLVVERRLRLDGGLVSLTGSADVAFPADFRSLGDYENALMQMDVELQFHDPRMYGPTRSSDTIAVAGSATVVVDGVADTEQVEVVLVGPLTDPTVTNTATGVSVTYTGSIASGETVTIDASAGTAISSLSGSVLGAISHAGDPAWMVLEPGDNLIELTAAAGTGTATVNYSAAYI